MQGIIRSSWFVEPIVADPKGHVIAQGCGGARSDWGWRSAASWLCHHGVMAPSAHPGLRDRSIQTGAPKREKRLDAGYRLAAFFVNRQRARLIAASLLARLLGGTSCLGVGFARALPGVGRCGKTSIEAVFAEGRMWRKQ
jgi:hypothetical protein